MKLPPQSLFERKGLNAKTLLLQPRMLAALPVRGLAMLQRSRGKYSRRTAGLFSAAYAIGENAETLLSLFLFYRDLGYKIPPRAATTLQSLRDFLSVERGSILQGLLLESGLDISDSDSAAAATRRRIAEQMQQRRDAFFEWLSDQAAGDIAVIGNAPKLLGGGHGEQIDGCGAVFRFNSACRNSADAGTKTDVLVSSPAKKSPAASAEVSNSLQQWEILSGPDMLFRIQDPDILSSLQHPHALTVPLVVWRNLVRRLNAPPSAGILILSWIAGELGSWQKIRAFGFGYDGGKYHATSASFRPSGRHNWAAERDLLHHWQAKGLDLQ